METRPDDLPDALVAEAVATGWGLPSPVVAYLPVGFGSHHWSVEDASGRRWFASVDSVSEGAGHRTPLVAAFTTARAARDSGMGFVVAAERTTGAGLTHPLGARYVLALYPHVDGTTGSFHDAYDLPTARHVVERLAELHRATPELLRAGARPHTAAPDLPDRAALETALDDALNDAEAPAPAGGAPWPGVYGERLRTALRRHAAAIREALRLHDAGGRAHEESAAATVSQERRLVVTHGEPHLGNVIRTSEGPVLVDWDTARLATPERDLWHVTSRLGPDDAEEVAALYAELGGRPLDPALLEHHRLGWALADVGSFVAELRHVTIETADTETAWRALVGTLEELAGRH